MRRNMELTGGLIYSQAVLLALTEAGLPRDAAYAVVQRQAMRTWAGEGDFRGLLAQDPEVARVLPRERLEACFDPRGFLRHVDRIYERVLGPGWGGSTS
jgi:adenylosuccinate lyase